MSGTKVYTCPENLEDFGKQKIAGCLSLSFGSAQSGEVVQRHLDRIFCCAATARLTVVQQKCKSESCSDACVNDLGFNLADACGKHQEGKDFVQCRPQDNKLLIQNSAQSLASIVLGPIDSTSARNATFFVIHVTKRWHGLIPVSFNNSYWSSATWRVASPCVFKVPVHRSMKASGFLPKWQRKCTEISALAEGFTNSSMCRFRCLR